MPTYIDIAPELSVYVTEEAAKDFANNVLDVPTPTYKQLSDLDPTMRSKFFVWLKWIKMPRKPAGLPDFVEYNARRVARLTGMSFETVNSLVKERDAIIAEVRANGEDAFKAHPVISDVRLDVPETGDVTISGQELAPLANGVSGVRFHRPPSTTIDRGAVRIVSDGGSITDDVIVVKAASVPAPMQAGDTLVVVADGIESGAYMIPGEG